MAYHDPDRIGIFSASDTGQAGGVWARRIAEHKGDDNGLASNNNQYLVSGALC